MTQTLTGTTGQKTLSPVLEQKEGPELEPINPLQLDKSILSPRIRVGVSSIPSSTNTTIRAINNPSPYTHTTHTLIKHLRAQNGLVFSVCNKKRGHQVTSGRRNLPLPTSMKSCQDKEQRLKGCSEGTLQTSNLGCLWTSLRRSICSVKVPESCLPRVQAVHTLPTLSQEYQEKKCPCQAPNTAHI